MKTTVLEKIFANYIDKFGLINDKTHEEYYKWQVAKRFRTMMDEALAADSSEFEKRLKEIRKQTFNLIDNYTTPLYGLCKFAEKDSGTVQTMFRNLLSSAGDALEVKQVRIAEFLQASHSLMNEHTPESFLYKDDMHSVSAYLFLYEPDKNYLFKASHALKFADYVEFYEDWGSGENVKLDVYYRMCDRLVEEMKKNEALMKTDASRFEKGWGPDPSTLHPDTEKHILAFDIIYCCSTYGLYDGIDYTKVSSKERKLILERKALAQEYYEKYKAAKEDERKYTDAVEFLQKAYCEGQRINHKNYNDGVVASVNNGIITAEFDIVGTKKLGVEQSVINGILHSYAEGYADAERRCIECLKKKEKIKAALSYAEKKLSDYAEYLD